MRYFILHFISCCIDEDQLNAREWLLYGRSPIDLLRLKWDACYVLRRSDIDNAKDLVEILHLYPIFKDPKAAFLVIVLLDKHISHIFKTLTIYRLSLISKRCFLERQATSTPGFLCYIRN